MKKKIKYISISVAICLLIGLISSFATQSSVDGWYLSLEKPAVNPPNWIFAPVWTVLYIMMGISGGLVWAKGFYHVWVKTALYHFGFQLLLNSLWSIVFFGLKAPLIALVVIVALLIMIVFTIRWFKVVDRTAAYMLLPYLVWVAFAAYLNYRIWILN
ncbi:MAG: TspO/MBR family protein [Sediminicola sp.]